jgi:hypothetical protein
VGRGALGDGVASLPLVLGSHALYAFADHRVRQGDPGHRGPLDRRRRRLHGRDDGLRTREERGGGSDRRAGGSVSDAGPSVVAAELTAHPGPFRPPGDPLARLDTTRPVGEVLDGLAMTLDTRHECRSEDP